MNATRIPNINILRIQDGVGNRIKMNKLPHVSNGLRYRDKIWRKDAKYYSKATAAQKIQIFKI